MPDKHAQCVDWIIYVFGMVPAFLTAINPYVGALSFLILLATFFNNERRKNKLLEIRIREHEASQRRRNVDYGFLDDEIEKD